MIDEGPSVLNDDLPTEHDEPSDRRTPSRSRRLVFEALDVLFAAGALQNATKTNHSFREAVRRTLGGLPARSLDRQWPQMSAHHRQHLADAYVHEVIRPRLGKPLANRRNVGIGWQLSLREAVELAGRVVRTLDRDQARLLLASDQLYCEYLFPWTLPLLAAPSLGLSESEDVLAEVEEDEREGLHDLRDLVETFLAGGDVGSAAESRFPHLVDPLGAEGTSAIPAAVSNEADPSMLQALAEGRVTRLLTDGIDGVRSELTRLVAMLDEPAQIELTGLHALGEDFEDAVASLHATIEDAVSALGEVDPDMAAQPPATFAALFEMLDAAGPGLARQRESAAAIAKLRRLASVAALGDAPHVVAAADAFAAAAIAAVQANQHVDHPLLGVIDLLSTPTQDIDYTTFWSETLPQLAQELPESLQPHLGLLIGGMLELPAPDLPIAADPRTGWVPDVVQDEAVARTDVASRDMRADAAENTSGGAATRTEPVPVAVPDEPVTGLVEDGATLSTQTGPGEGKATRESAGAAEEPTEVGPQTADSVAVDDADRGGADTDPSKPTAADADSTAAAALPVPEASREQAPISRPDGTEPSDSGGVDAVDEALRTTVSAKRWSASYWVARAARLSPIRIDALELAAYGMQMRRLDGRLTGPFTDTFARLEPSLDDAMRSPVDRTLLVGAALRAALISPYAGAMALSNLAPRIGAAPSTSQLLEALIPAAQAGVRVGADAPAYARTGAAESDPLAEIAEQAQALLDAAPQQKFAYQPASNVWHLWMQPNGRLGRLLTRVVRRVADDVGNVADEAERMRKGLETAIATDDRRLRRHRADRKEIEATARMQLLHKGEHVLDLVAEWAQVAVDLARSEPQGWEQQRFEVLRDAIIARREGVRDELAAACQDDEIACAVADAVLGELDHLFDRLLAGDPLRGIEPAPHVARNVALLKVGDLAVNTETLEPEDPEAVTSAIIPALALDLTWEEAFSARASAGYHDETTAILAQIAVDPDAGGEELAEQLARRREKELLGAHAAAVQAWGNVQRELETARMHGFLDTGTAAELTRRLRAAQPHPGRVDIGRVVREVSRVADKIGAAREAAIEIALIELDEEADRTRNVATHADVVRERISVGDLAVARDQLLRLKKGGSPDEERPYEPEFNGRFSVVLADRAEARFDSEAVKQMSGRLPWGDVDYSGLPDSVLERASIAGISWVDMSSQKVAVTPGNVAAVLGALGLTVRNPERDIITVRGSGSPQHVWRQVTFADQVVSPVPQFGTDARGRLRLLITWDGITPRKLVNLAVTQGNRRPVVCLHFGTFNPAQRRELAEVCRPDQQNAQLVVIDDVLFGYRLSLDEDQWAATMRLALPYSAVNPYIPDAPELPQEMFFGRRDELGQILDLRGTCVIYGGRKLGKSALLREAARLFDAEGDHAVAVYLDVKNHNIGFGTKATAEELWPVLRKALEDAGVPLDDPGGDPEAAHASVREGLLAWLAEEPRREALVLLDECDQLLDADAVADERNPFPLVRGLYELSQASDRRFKPVFAGLHEVQRFQRLPNQPFAHLGRAIALGGLDPKAAYDLIYRPLTAIGCTFESRHVVSRVLAYTNYHPALLQVFGWEMTRYLLKRPRETDPPYLITMDDVDAVMGDERTTKAIRDKFVDTINLDPRYELIAYTLALHDHVRGYGTLVSPSELRALCEQWRSPENQVLPEDDRAGETFRRLLDEMVELGVLAPPVSGLYAMRSPVVTQLLGDEERLLELLDKFSRTIPSTVDPSHDRRTFTDSTPRWAYPLTERQLDALIQPYDTLRLVLSTEALGGGDIDDALLGMVKPPGLEIIMFPQLAKRASPKLPKPKTAVQRLLVCDVRGQTREKLDHALVNGSALVSGSHAGKVIAVVHVDAAHLPVWRRVAAGQVLVSDRDVPITVLRRWTTEGIRLWAQRAELTLVTSADADRVVEATGGWPVLLRAAAEKVPAFGGSLPDAAEYVRSLLETPEEANRFAAQTGLDQLADEELRVWHQLLLWAETSPVDAQDLAGVIAGETGEPTRSQIAEISTSLEVLAMLGMTVRGDDGSIAPEPVARAVWHALGVPARA